VDPQEDAGVQGADVAAPDHASFQDAKQAVGRWIKRFGFWAGTTLWAVASVLSFLVHYHVLPDHWKVVPDQELPALALVIGLMFILSEQVKEYKDKADKSAEMVQKRVTLLDRDIRNLLTELAPQFALLQCVARLQQAFHTIPHGDLLSIRHLGLDMQTAWLYVHDKLFEVERKTQRMKIHYRLLMIVGDYAKLGNVSPELQDEMKQMCEGSRASLQNIKNYFERGAQALNHVDIEIRTYASLPVVHGIHADKPTPVHYVALCGWRGSEHSYYHWGEGHYHEIHGLPQSDTSASDMLDLFDGYFEHLWSIGEIAYRNHPDTSAPPRVARADGDRKKHR
jgi:hypothetical protein